MSMNWPDEKYVKLYVRDSLTWRSWCWQARAIFPNILRKLDGAGIIETGNLEPAVAVARQIDFPADVVRVGLEDILASETLKKVAGGLESTAFIAAQEARKTEALKKRDQRERVAAARRAAEVAEIRTEAVPTPSHDVPSCPVLSPSSPAQPVPSPAQPEKRRVAENATPLAFDLEVQGDPPTMPPKAPREEDALCADFEEIIGKPYVWSGAKDGTAFARLRRTTPLEEIRSRWRGALRSTDKWLGVRTIAQLASKWNDLAKVPLDLTGDWRSRVDHTQDFFKGVQ